MSVSAVFEQSVNRDPQQVAISQGETRVTYQQLLQRVTALSAALRRQPGSPFTLVLLEEGAALVTAALAIMHAGQAFVPLSPTLPRQRLETLLAQFPDARLISTSHGLASVRHLTDRLNVVEVDELGVPALCAGEPLPLAPTRTQPLAYVYFTSGSTGIPKAVLGRSDSLLHFIEWESRELAITPDDRVSMLTSQMFDPFLRDMLLPLLNGATLCIPPSREVIHSPAALLAWIQAQRITVTHQIPSLLQVLLEYPDAAQRLHALRYVLLAGEMLKGSLVARFYHNGPANAQLINLYGPTETTLAKLFYRVTPADAVCAGVPVGRPIPGASISVIDESGNPVADGESGEVIIITPWMSAGYRQPAASDAFFTDERGTKMYRTGDVGRLTATGDLELLGRNDFQLKINGQRVETAEIETLLERHPAVRQAAVVAFAQPQQLVAFITLKSKLNQASTELRDYLAASLPAALLPTDFSILELFPRLPNGKLDRKALPQPAPRRSAPLTAAQQPHAGEEQKLAAIWQRLLPVNAVGRDDDFFALGGNSLLAMRMIACVRAELDRELEFAALLAQPTLAGSTQALRQAEQDSVQTQSSVTLSDEQQGMWLIQQQAPESPVWQLAYRAEWQGPLNIELLQQALNQALRRHDALRTRFIPDQDGVTAQIAEQVVVDIDRQDFGAQGSDARGAAEGWLTQLATRPFNLAQAPLLRIACAQVQPHRTLIALVCHHIIADAESVALLWRQMLADYGRLLAGKTLTPVAATSCQTVHARRQQQRSAGPRGEALRAWWRHQLAGPLPLLQLPYDFPVPAVRSYCGGRIPFHLSQATAGALAELAVRHGVTPYVALLTAYTAFMARYTLQQDLTIGTPISSRHALDNEQAFGLLFNVVALRQAVDLHQPFSRLMRQVAASFIAAVAHQDLPFGQVLTALEETRHPGISPLFQTLFVWQQKPDAATRLGQSSVSALQAVDRGSATYELTLEMWPDETGIAGQFEYADDRFLPDTIARMAANFTTFVEHCVADSEEAVGRLPLLSEAERRQIWQWNQTAQPFSSDIGIHQMFERQVARTPDAPALEFLDEVLSYRELDARANQLAHWLIAQGVGVDVAVGLCIERSLSLVIGFLAILKADGVYVPIDPDYPQERSDYVIADSGLQLMLTQAQFVDRFTRAAQHITLFTVEALEPQLNGLPTLAPAPRAGADNTAYIIYTSGSTGQPKGVPIRHRGVCNLAETEVALLDMQPPGRVLQFASFSFDTSVWEIVMTLCSGCTLLMAPRLSLLPGPDLLEQLEQRRVSHVTLPASALAALPEAPLPDLRVLIVAGEACGLDLLQKWGKTRRFINSYGPTETTVSATNAELTPADSRVHIGRPVHNTQVWILDEFHEPLPVGVVGELCIGGVGVSQGYLNQPALTADRFIADPFSATPEARLYRTGDLACYRSDGNIDYLGRIDNQVKIRGYRVELGEIETALRRHPAVADAVTLVREDYLAASAVVAYVLPHAGQQPDRAQLHAWLAATLPEFMCPACYVLMTAFPRLPNNKIDRKRFPTPQPDAVANAPGEAPKGRAEQAIAAVWSRVLGIEGIGRDDSFFALGGHSLLAARAVALLAAEHQLHLRVSDIFTRRTPRQLALCAGETLADSALCRQPALKEAPLSFAQQRIWFLEQLHPDGNSYITGEIKTFTAPTVTPERLSAALDALFRHFPLLNTRLRPDGAVPHQYWSDAPVEFTAEGVDDDAWHARVQQRAAALMSEPFTLLAAPLYRLCFIHSPQGQSALIFCVHHLLVDEHTLSLIDQSLTLLIDDPQAACTAPAVSYLQYAAWERSTSHREGLDWWREVFLTPPPVIALPQRPQPDETDWRAAYQTLTLPLPLTEALRQLARQQDTTLFTLLLSTFQLLLQRYSGENDLTIGLPVSLRDSDTLQNLPGLLLNTLAFRQTLDTSQPFATFLAASEAALREALAHKETPFEQVVNAVLPAEGRATSPLFRIMFVYNASPDERREGAEARLSSQALNAPDAKFDLTLFVQETATQLTLNIEYRPSLYSAEAIDALAASYGRLLASLSRRPQLPACRLDMLSEAEQRHLLDTLSAGPHRAAAPLLQQRFEQQARATPQATALAWGERQMSYQQLNQQANRLAHLLAGLDIGPSARVAVLLPRSPTLVCAILATVKSGAAWVPVDIAYPAERIRYMLDDARVARVITTREQALRLGLTEQQTMLLTPEMTTDGDVGMADPAQGAVAEDPAYVLYTSGTTGAPKGVVIPHRALANYLQHACDNYDCAQGRGNTLHASISFDATLTSLFLPLLSGKTLFILPDEEDVPALVSAWKQLSGMTMAKITPSHLELLSQQIPPAAAGHAATLVIGGENLAGAAVRFWREHAPQVSVVNEYGPTETTVGCCVYALAAGECAVSGAVPIGRPIANMRIFLLDEHRQLTPPGGVGEIYIGGAGVALGYFNRPELTASRFIDDPFAAEPGERLYRTGDLARWLPDGNLLYLGRRDNQVKLRGHRIELEEVEAQLVACEGVSQAATGIRQVNGRPHLVAYVALAKGTTALDGVRQQIAHRLPEIMRPTQWLLLPSIPLTGNGKIDRAWLAAQPLPVTVALCFRAAESETERQLATIWQKVLGGETPGMDDDFFALGGDSILSLQIVFLAREAGLRVQARMLFDYPTIASLASVVEPLASAPAQARPAMQAYKLLPAQRWFFALGAEKAHHYNQSYLWRLDAQVNLPQLERALRGVLQQHEGLRARFRAADAPATIATLTDAPLLRETRLGAPHDDEAAVIAWAGARQSQLDIAQGPVFSADVIRAASADYLLLSVHHLVVDGVSWRIIISDLSRAYQALTRGEALPCEPTTASLAEWGAWLQQVVDPVSAADEHRYWETQRHAGAAIPVDSGTRALPGRTGEMRKVQITLDRAATQALVRQTGRAYHTHVGDLLLAALAQTLSEWTGSRRLRIDFEGHGRDDAPDAPDVSRTVGWFTAIYPILLQLPSTGSWGDLIQDVKEAQRRVPHGGVGYGMLYDAAAQAAEVCFNYLGQFDGDFHQPPLSGVADLLMAHRYAPENRRGWALEVDSYIDEGELVIVWSYNPNSWRAETIAAQTDAMKKHLDALIAHCQAQARTTWTPSDFPLAGLSRASLLQLQQRHSQIVDIYPLTPTQEGMLYHSLADGDARLYHEQICFDLARGVDLARLQQAWTQVIAACPALRTTFDLNAEAGPLQLVHQQMPDAWRVVDYRSPQEEDIAALWRADREQGFDLHQGPLFRITVLLAQDSVQMLFSHHHAILDGWSVTLLLAQVAAAYHQTPPPPSAPAFRHYIQWLRRSRAGSQAHWQQRLAGLSAATPLPASYPGRTPSRQRQRQDFQLDAALSAQLARFGRRHRLTISTLVQGAWALLLQRYSGSTESLFGVTLSGRHADLSGIERMVGLLIGTVPMRASVQPGVRVVDWLHALQRQQLENERFSDISLAELKHSCGLAGWPTLFDTLVVFENNPQQENNGLFSFAAAQESTNYPLTLVASFGAALSGVLVYDDGLYSPHTAGQLTQHLLHILQQWIDADDRRLSEISLLDASGNAALLKGLQGPVLPLPEGGVYALFAQRAAAMGDHIAVIEGELSLTYDRLRQRAEQISARLHQRGLRAGDRVALFLPRGVEYVAAMLAASRIGLCYVPIDAASPAERVRYLLSDSQCPLTLTQQTLAGALPSDQPLLLVDEASPDLPLPPELSQGNSLAYILYTSGSTGRPKGVMIEHRSLMNYLLDACRRYQLRAGMQSLFHSSVSFDATLTSLWLPLLTGGTLVAIPGEGDLQAMARHLSTSSAEQLLKITPVHLALLQEQLDHAAKRRVSALVVGGEALNCETVQRWLREAPDTRIYNEYGPTETVVGCCVHLADAARDRQGAMAIGLPIANTRLLVLNEDRSPTPPGAEGELYIAGAGLARGYWNRPDLTEEKFITLDLAGETVRAYRTGDRVGLMLNGELMYFGRCDHQLKVRGYRIEPGEIEEQLMRHPQVLQSAVALQPGRSQEDAQLAAWVVPQQAGMESEALRAFLALTLPGYMIPGAIVVLPALPLTSNGKVDYGALPLPVRPQHTELLAPATPLESAIQATWGEILRCGPVSCDQNFFALGGHSLHALRVAARLENQLNVRVSLTDLLNHQTVRQLAAVLAQRTTPISEERAITRVSRRQERPL